MMLHKLLNTSDYTAFQLSIALAGSILWVIAYFILIKDTIKNKYIEMPFAIACGNFAWEILYAYVFDDYINLGEVYVWGYRAWFYMDILIFFLLLRYGKKQTDNLWINKYFKEINIGLLLFFLVFFYAWISVGFDNTPIHGNGLVKLGATSAYILNFGISVLYIIQFYYKNKLVRFSKSLAWCKGIGTGLFTILFWQIDPQNYLVQSLGVLIFIGDSFYLFLLYKYQPEISTKFDFSKVEFFDNPKFNELWNSKPEYLVVHNQKLRYFKKDSWTYKSPSGKYESSISVVEGNILVEVARGSVDQEDVLEGLNSVLSIVRELKLENHYYYYISDSRKITNASLDSRKIVIDFHQANTNLKQFVLITNGFTKVLIKLMTPINPDVINNWILSDSVENGIYELHFQKFNKTTNFTPFESYTDKRINDTFEMISNISLRKFDITKPKNISENDPFYGIFTSLEILKNDNKEVLQELNSLLIDSRKALKEQELRFKHLFENSYEIILVVDTNDILINANNGAKKYWSDQGIDLKEGFNIYNFLKSQDEIQFYENAKKELSLGKRHELELKFNSKEAEKTWLFCKCHPVKISEKLTYMVFLMNDISEQKQLEEEKQMMNEKIIHQSIKLDEFSNLLSNDLKNQAVTMITVIENLKNSLNYTSVNLSKVTLLRKALDDMDVVIKNLDKVLNEVPAKDFNSEEQDEKQQKNKTI